MTMGWTVENGRASREKQVPREARNDSQKDNGNGKSNGKGKYSGPSLRSRMTRFSVGAREGLRTKFPMLLLGAR
jgi:hypothetical protein